MNRMNHDVRQDSKSMHNLFVYGTLKRGQTNHFFLAGLPAKLAKAPQIVLHTGKDYPFARRGKGITYGEVYYINHRLLTKIDRLERHPDLFQRELTTVILLPKRIHIEAWIYLHKQARRHPRVMKGHWQNR
ncbi:gamma-glutamylcyclotransferase family protein [Beggiatoa leptomitoformis]|uniref:Gamma-glutamylcyclotransferase family protein n=1 Tax=Beggiatoa leptomitoformis TaxID=288004 RepID=A0A2N9YEF3_9GAMM|nr:gamma-glutamylcyclotransferase family protein [Beggiatoa leptomitoformis]ALG68897.2 gamma-glutamylcyclotransferase [Beggiatoa leptomitoformis]AUI68729.2 gamma-glutamylcyclotransferase [Beggiatoa leptomitoformis]